jgi:uncharacterized protein YdhG (YjbR/CyaY superfamily)
VRDADPRGLSAARIGHGKFIGRRTAGVPKNVMIPADRGVTDYIATVPEDRRDALKVLRTACRTELTGFAEQVRYGMPAYVRDGATEIAFASQKRYISLYIARTDVMAAYRSAFAGLSLGTGCVRFRRPDQIDVGLITALLRDTSATRGPVC